MGPLRKNNCSKNKYPTDLKSACFFTSKSVGYLFLEGLVPEIYLAKFVRFGTASNIVVASCTYYTPTIYVLFFPYVDIVEYTRQTKRHTT